MNCDVLVLLSLCVCSDQFWFPVVFLFVWDSQTDRQDK